MVQFKSTLQKFAEQGEKTGWTFIEVPSEIAQQIKPGVKKSYRVKGKFDDVTVQRLSLVPMGEGDFIIAVNAALRKALRKQKGDSLVVQLEEDTSVFEIDKDFLDCLNDEPKALRFFNTLSPSHQNYYGKWIESAKTIDTKSKRIARAINTLARGMNYAEMIREQVAENKKMKE